MLILKSIFFSIIYLIIGYVVVKKTIVKDSLFEGEYPVILFALLIWPIVLSVYIFGWFGNKIGKVLFK